MKIYIEYKELLFTRKLDTRCQAMRQEVVPAKFQPHASQMNFKWAEISNCLQFTVNSYYKENNRVTVQPMYVYQVHYARIKCT